MTKSPTRMLSFRCSGLMSMWRRQSPEEKNGSEDGFLTHFPCTRFVNSAAMRGSISTAVHDLHFSRIRTVRLPVPGPTSRTTSEGRRFALSTMLRMSSPRVSCFEWSMGGRRRASRRTLGRRCGGEARVSLFGYDRIKKTVWRDVQRVLEDMLTELSRAVEGRVGS